MLLRFLLLAFLLFAGFANATELRHINVRAGTEGLAEAPLTISNDLEQPLSCNADLAHWYSVELAAIAPGARATLALWFEPETGTFTVLNDKAENMPIERLWCGLASRAYITRAQIALDHTAAGGELARGVACTGAGDRVTCK